MNIKRKWALALLMVAPLLLNACTYGRISGKYSQAEAIKGQGGCYKVGNP